MNPIEFVKAHPVATGAVIIGAVVVFMIVGNMGGGGEAQAAGPVGVALPQGGGDAGVGLQLQAAQLAAQTRADEIAATERIALGEQATTKAIAEITAQIQGKGIEATQTINLATIGANKEVDLSKNTLAAQVANAQSAAETERVRSTNATIAQQSADLRAVATTKSNNETTSNIFTSIFRGIGSIFGF